MIVSLQRFFVPIDALSADRVYLKGKQANQISHVLRMRKGDSIIVLDNTGWEYRLILENISHHEIIGLIQEKNKNLSEPELNLSLYTSLLKHDHFEFVLQKCTEIGVRHFIPFLSERTISNRQEWSGKNQRWIRIIQEASEQSGRGIMPTLSSPIDFYSAIQDAGQFNQALIPYEKEVNMSLSKTLTNISAQTSNSIAIFIGPEGGFTEAEVESALVMGIQSVSLGKRILRAETAAIIASTLTLNHYNELGIH